MPLKAPHRRLDWRELQDQRRIHVVAALPASLQPMHVRSAEEEKSGAMEMLPVNNVYGTNIQIFAPIQNRGKGLCHLISTFLSILSESGDNVCRALQSLTTSLQQHQSVLKSLFPARDVQSLLGLTRDELVELIATPFTLNNSPALSQDVQTRAFYSTEEGRNLECLEETPNQDEEWDESRRNQEPISHVSDDVNGLSLSVDRQRSYVGVSSIKAALRVILMTSPTAARTLLSQSSGRATRAPTPSNRTPSSRGISPTRATRTPSGLKKQPLIDAYFSLVHVLVPMVDEEHFRLTWKKVDTSQPDASWLALLNMVLAMGTIAACKSDEDGHIQYYTRAKQLLGLEGFGSGRLEALQALILMGGYYLHYLNRPNEAGALTGAAIRMGLAMGLHREHSEMTATSNTEVRRRTWWCLFCLDTSASMSLGRPTLRWGPGITIRAPEQLNSAIRGQYQDAHLQLFIEDTRFCRIATNVQDRLAMSPFVEFTDMAMLDTELYAWFLNLKKKFEGPDSTAFLTARAILNWRYYNLRIVLHRPVLLRVAMRGLLQESSLKTLSSDEISAIGKCRTAASKAIDDIGHHLQPNQLSGWNGAWFLYQACMVPLVSIFMDPTNKGAGDWRQQIEAALELFDRMADWSLAARRTKEVVSRVYEASKGCNAPNALDSVDMLEVQGNWDELNGGSFWDNMMWDTFPDNLDLSLNGLADFEPYPNGDLWGCFLGDNARSDESNGPS
ncbi:hypothetical protein MMC13_008247 [Lambiella insularis]|nr:hypothetical protein [Lambiella insularis]